jgi:hypothetical protein
LKKEQEIIQIQIKQADPTKIFKPVDAVDHFATAWKHLNKTKVAESWDVYN